MGGGVPITSRERRRASFGALNSLRRLGMAIAASEFGGSVWESNPSFPSKRGINGFEGRASHQTSFASDEIIAAVCGDQQVNPSLPCIAGRSNDELGF